MIDNAVAIIRKSGLHGMTMLRTEPPSSGNIDTPGPMGNSGPDVQMALLAFSDCLMSSSPDAEAIEFSLTQISLFLSLAAIVYSSSSSFLLYDYCRD